MIMEFGYKSCAGSVFLGAYFLLLSWSKERGEHGELAKAEQEFVVSVKVQCSERKNSEEQREKKVTGACYVSCGNLRQVRRVGQAASNETATIKDSE